MDGKSYIEPPCAQGPKSLTTQCKTVSQDTIFTPLCSIFLSSASSGTGTLGSHTHNWRLTLSTLSYAVDTPYPQSHWDVCCIGKISWSELVLGSYLTS